MLTRLNRAISKFLYKGAVILACWAGIQMLAMGLVVFLGVLGRKLPFIPAPLFAPAYEWGSMLMAGVSACALVYCWYVGGHIRIDMLPEWLEERAPRARAVLDLVGTLCALLFVIAVAWVNTGMGIERIEKVRALMGFRTQIGPPTLAFAIAMWFFAIALVRSIIGFALKAAGRKVEHDGLY